MRKAKYFLISFCLLLVLTACSNNKVEVQNISFDCPENYEVKEVKSENKINTYHLVENGKLKAVIDHTTDHNTAYVMFGDVTVRGENVKYINIDDMACAEYEDKEGCWHVVIYKKTGDDSYDAYRFVFTKGVGLEVVNSIVYSIKYKTR